jgi:hypothetical protein
MVKVFSTIAIWMFTKEILKTTKLMAMGNTSMQIKISIRVNGKMISIMDRARRSRLMDALILANS